MEFFDLLLNNPEALAALSPQDVAGLQFGAQAQSVPQSDTLGPGTAGAVPMGMPAGAPPAAPAPAAPLQPGASDAMQRKNPFAMTPEMIKALMLGAGPAGAQTRPSMPSAPAVRPGAAPSIRPPIGIGALPALQPGGRRGY